jgi:HSP20 family protein
MVKWYYRSVFDELDDIRKYRELLNRQIYGTNPAALLPAAGESAVKMLPAQPMFLSMKVSENDDEVMVTATLIAGIMKKDIALYLINPLALEITCERTEERTDENEGYYLHGCMSGSVTRTVTLPEPVSDNGSSALVRNDVLEVHLKKTRKKSKRKIPVD